MHSNPNGFTMTRSRALAVESLLQQVRDLDAERTQLEDPLRADAVKRCIFRKLWIIDIVRTYEYVNGKPRRIFDDYVNALREKMECRVQDLELLDANYTNMNPYSSLGSPPRFPFFEGIQHNVKHLHIFNRITSPEDKRTVAALFPESGWAVNVANVGAVLPHLLQKKLLSLSDILTLGETSVPLKNAIIGQFEEVLDGDELAVFPVTGLCELENLSKYTHLSGPVPACLKLTIENAFQANIERLVKRLARFETNILDIFLVFMGRPSINHVKVLKCVLQCLPNLIRLRVWGYTTEDEDADELMSDSFGESLPEMYHLKTLLIGAYSTADEDCWRKLVSKYSSQLRFFGYDGKHIDLSVHDWRSLEALKLRQEDEINNDPEVYAMFQSSPLKNLSSNQNFFESQDFVATLRVFSQTLETIHIEPDNILWEFEINSAPPDNRQTNDETWLTNIEFPRVKKLFLGCSVSNGVVLLLFPSLETVSFKNGITHPDSYFINSSGLGLSWDANQLQESILWKLLPSLKEIELLKCGRPNLVTHRYKVLRRRETNIKSEISIS